jgi:hypothetical protein
VTGRRHGAAPGRRGHGRRRPRAAAARLGAIDAMRLDSGGSTTLVADGRVLNRRTERASSTRSSGDPGRAREAPLLAWWAAAAVVGRAAVGPGARASPRSSSGFRGAAGGRRLEPAARDPARRRQRATALVADQSGACARARCRGRGAAGRGRRRRARDRGRRLPAGLALAGVDARGGRRARRQRDPPPRRRRPAPRRPRRERPPGTVAERLGAACRRRGRRPAHARRRLRRRPLDLVRRQRRRPGAGGADRGRGRRRDRGGRGRRPRRRPRAGAPAAGERLDRHRRRRLVDGSAPDASQLEAGRVDVHAWATAFAAATRSSRRSARRWGAWPSWPPSTHCSWWWRGGRGAHPAWRPGWSSWRGRPCWPGPPGVRRRRP